MIELIDYDRAVVAEIDDIVYQINLEYDVFITTLVFGKNELLTLHRLQQASTSTRVL